jgi:NAD(P) transhydrogenase subunit beta
VLVALVVGGGLGAVMAKRVEMTKMPELVAFMHSMIGLAAVFIASPPPSSPGPSASSPRAAPFRPATGWSWRWARPSVPSPSAAR